MALQSLILPILSVFRSAGLQQASGALRSLTGNFNSLAGQIGLAAGSFSAFSALTTAKEFTTASVQATSLFERNLLALNQVFEELEPRLVSFTREVESYGLSQSQAAQASVFLGSVLKQYGFSVSETAGQTERLVTLAQDLATTYGYDVQEALLAITALFRGEYDPIEKFGVAMKQNEVNARLAAQGLNDLEGAELANAQAIARLDMLFERAGDSIGAFTRATDTLYGSQQKLNAVLGNLQIAAGTPLQQPLAQINNIFAQIFQESGPGIVQIFESLGQFISVIAPVLGQTTQLLFNVIGPLQQIINLFTGLLGPVISAVIIPVFTALNSILETFNSLLDGVSGQLALVELNFKRIIAVLNSDPVFKELINTFVSLFTEANPLIQAIKWLGEEFEKAGDAARAAAGDFDVYNGGAKAASVAARRAGYEARDAKDSFEILDAALRGAATGATDAEGKLDGLAGVFQRIDDAIEQSKAKQSLEDLGFSAGFIEEVLTRPNWKEIFGAIAEYARLAAIEVGTLFDKFDFLMYKDIEDRKEALLNTIADGFKGGTTNAAASQGAKDTVQAFFDSFEEEIQKQRVRAQLRLRGASEGLIEAIVGSQGWMKLWIQIKQGKLSLEELQNQFYQTAAGAKELQDAAAAAADAIADYQSQVQAIEEKLAQEIAAIREQAKKVKQSFKDIVDGFKILPTIEKEIGRFEAQVTSYAESIQQALKTAFENGDILKKGYKRLSEYVTKELELLRQVAAQRDELAQRYQFAEQLIQSYEDAFKATLNLTSLFSRLKTESEKTSVTEVQRGIIALGSSLRQFEVTIARTYEETIDKITDKSVALVQSFRDMAQRARDFAANLRILRELQIDPELFQQLVDAGVEAGAETAAALVAGGPDAINEINAIYQEIDQLGADLGEEVAITLYGSGIDLANGLLEGIKSKQEELAALATSMAENFAEAFTKSVNKAINQAMNAAIARAQAAAAAAISALGPPPSPVDVTALSQINNLIAGAQSYIQSVGNAAQAAGGGAKLDIYENLRDQILAGVSVDMSGIQSGLSTAQLQAAAQAAVRTNNTYNVTVTADSRLSGAKAGEAVVESLTKFSQTNGNFQVGITV